MKAERNETSGLGSLAAIFDALDRGKAIVPTGGGALIELDAEAYTYKLSGTAVMVCDADDVAALREFLSLGDGPSLRARCGRIMVGSGTDTYDPTCDLPEGHVGACASFGAIDQHRLQRRCEQCGREGQRGFRIIPPARFPGQSYGATSPIVVCANENACRKRWPKPTDDAMERIYA